eukprot:TRINITY_DN549_c1_g1_i1.p2 TRINITY_DN549_c1_g1~~TRINITY_DN549_c1_g1_i1.p2  ORF type:complete len:404 (+),score=153.55 TRINITY_DN549_c1_g1_i1:83-1213(+)
MPRPALLLALTAAACVSADSDVGKPGPQPKPSRQLKRYTIDLDAPPETRWVQPALDHKEYVLALLDVLKALFLSPAAKNITMAMVEAVKLPDENRREIQGLADALGVQYTDALMAGMFYEISGQAHILAFQAAATRSCTSIIAQNSNGTVFGRNQDYPPPFSPLQFDGTFIKGGKKVYEGTTFAGTTGIGGTCIVPGGFSVSIDARGANTPALDESLKLARSGAYMFPMLTRAACERALDFESAVKFLADTPMILGGYFIMAGTQPGEGAVVTRNATAPAGTDVWRLSQGYPKGGDAAPWFLVQTNYDHWNPAPSSDDRRDPAIKAMEAVGRDAVDFDRLWQVLSTKPVYNAATIHTDFAWPATGEYRTYLRHNVV